jgi:hypothetical protein
MQEVAMDIEKLFSNSIYLEQERKEADELSAFTREVAQVFGSQQASMSERDWLDESESMDTPPVATVRNWRAVTIAASFRLAGDQLGIGAFDVRTIKEDRMTISQKLMK